jgi:capsular polysaccharide biosynthesis protein
LELKRLWKIAWRWGWLILLPALVVGAYSLVTYSPPAASYGMTLRFTAGQPETPAGESAPGFDPNYYRWLASEYIVGGLKDWVRTGAFAQAVSAELAAQGLALPPEAVAGAIVASDNARSILLVYLAGGDPAHLQVLAAAVTRVLQTQNAAVFPQLGGQAAVVTPLDAPSVAAVPPSLRSRLDLPLRLALALAAGAALALAAHYLDPFVRERAELERLGLAVVGEIPRVGK